MDGRQYLLYRLYSSGLSNERMSLEVAFGLASITGRTLVLYGDQSAQRQLTPTRGGRYRLFDSGWFVKGSALPHYQPIVITDLYEELPALLRMPGDHGCVPEHWFDSEGPEIFAFREQLSNYCFWSDSQGGDADVLLRGSVHSLKAQFADGRPLLPFPSQQVWRLEGSNLSYYSRLINDASGKLSGALRGMRIHSWILDFANSVTERLGDYNGCHIRLTDMLDFLPQSKDYHEVIAECLSGAVDPDSLLIVSTDEDPSSEFFSPLRKRFKRILFLDDFIRDECDDLWGRVPFLNECVLGLICQAVLARSAVFLGTPGSTFTGMIHRGWLAKNKGMTPSSSLNFRYVHSGLAGSPAQIPGYFENATFVESNQGAYSWNRVQIRSALKGQLSWYREWPEALLAT